MTPDEILDKVKQIQQEVQDIKQAEPDLDQDDVKRRVFTTHSEFSMNHPATFLGAVDNTIDLKTMEYMVSMANRVKRDDITQHDASVEIGTKLVDTYVKPTLEKGKK
jgi:hypothetical protein